MRSEVIIAANIDAAAEQILDQLKADTSSEGRSKGNVIYFDGWDGLGASAVLQAVAQRLTAVSGAPTGLQFGKIIHIDCSKWESRRAFQRALAHQLELPTEVMEMFDKQDEDDDYRGLDQGSRLRIPQVQRAMHQRIQDLNCRFLVIFHNGSNEEIDLASFGFPLSEYLDNKVLWTFQGRFRLYPKIKIREALRKSTATNKTDVFILACKPDERDPQEFWPVLVCQEAAEVAQQSMMASIIRGIGIDQLAQSFILHMLKLCCIGHHFMLDYDLATQADNYWICDGILHQLQLGDDDELWQAADAFKREILLDVDHYKYNHQYFPSYLLRYANSKPHWTWPPYEFLPIPASAIPNADMFQDFNKLSVLKLSHRTFNFSSPPYVHCHNLKFLWLDNCHDDQEEMNKLVRPLGAAGTTLQRCLGGLLVLHILDTCCDKILSVQMMDLMTQLRELNVIGAQDWDMGHLRGRLPSIRKLRVTKSRINCNGSSSSENDDLFSGKEKMGLLEFSGNNISNRMKSITMAANNGLLETVLIDDGCVGLEQISFRGCAKLKNVLLRGLFKGLKRIDISGTAVKTLDLSAVVAKELDELTALECNELCTILSPPTANMKERLSKLRANNTTVEGRRLSTSSSSVKFSGLSPMEYDWYIFARDTRFLLSSLVPVAGHISVYPITTILKGMHLEISSPIAIASDVGGSEENGRMISKSNEEPGITNSTTAPVYTAALKEQVHQAISQGDDDGLPRVRCIWNFSRPSMFYWFEYLHVDLCPRLTHVLPLSSKLILRGSGTLRSLVTIEIVWCGDLKEVFPVDDIDDAKDNQKGWKQQATGVVKFPQLTRIHLHELPMMHGICGHWRIYAPYLQSIKIRGCWSLTRLPFVWGERSHDKKVECDCEKEWWDRLNWDAKHDSSLYKPTHPRYYKKTMLKGSVLV
ncbi:hypothetical protein QOZ80_5AG0391480 [Eleusine coracana subsp. coracana]|nr:hypothetical protein QOZ80_5AG0391480 [Eleusine coracana subsp. coracana]